MSRTGLTVAVAAGLAALSLALFLVRRQVLGAEINGPHGSSTWRITVAVSGTTPADLDALVILPPLDFRQQHIYDEEFESDQLSHRVVHAHFTDRREVIWQRRSGTVGQPFQVIYSFHASLGLWPPTRGMDRVSEIFEAPPWPGTPVKRPPPGKSTFLKPGFRVQSEHKEIQLLAARLAPPALAPADKLRALFEHVRMLEARDALAGQSAVECLRAHGGSSGGRSRLLVAMCRAQGIPARLVTGLVLDDDGPRELHFWVEAYVNLYWLPMCPVHGHFGVQTFPKHYLVFNIGEGDVVRGRDSNMGSPSFTADQLEAEAGSSNDAVDRGPVAWVKLLSLYRLRPGEQQMVRFLLLLPLAALIVSLFRTLIGVPTFGTFAPALMGMVFLDLAILPWGMLIFFVIVMVGWGCRRLLDRLHLLQVPRVSALLTLLVIVLVAGVVLASHLGLPVTRYLLLPLVILTHLVERFWTIEAEDSTAASFKTLLGTFVAATAISVALSPRAVGIWMFRYPETTGVVLACLLLLGRYTGYRLTELYRFQDIIQDGANGRGNDELAGTVAEAPGSGRAGNEPAQCRVHPGPEPAPPVSGGGRQTADAGIVPANRRSQS
jgi:transglutaminase-like putative cysteine protease